MIKHIGATLFAFLIIIPALFAGERYERIYVFGDSLSDNGNLATITGPLPEPPYFQNRITNGLTAVDVLAGKLGLPLEASLHLIGPAVGANYAVAGASAETHGSIDLTSQVALFLANHGGVAPDDALYVMFLGGNDIRHARDSGDATQAAQIVADATGVINTQMQVLAMAGARNWLVVNAPDIGAIPETGLIAATIGDISLPAKVSALSQQFNVALHAQIEQLEDELDIEVEDFDLFAEFNQIINTSVSLGFTNNSDACFSSLLGQFNPGCNFGLSFGEYVFFDEIHPTAGVHAMIGERMFAEIAEHDAGDRRKGTHKEKHRKKRQHHEKD